MVGGMERGIYKGDTRRERKIRKWWGMMRVG